VPFDEMNWKQSTSPFSFRDVPAERGVAVAVVPVDADHVAARIFFESTRVPRLSAITDPAEGGLQERYVERIPQLPTSPLSSHQHSPDR